MFPVVDCIIASYEKDAVAVRAAELAAVVDLRVIVQASTTFNGRNPVPVLYQSSMDTVVWVLDLPDELDPVQCEHWLRDQSLILAREFVDHEGWFLVADGDEIPHPDAIREAVTRPSASVLHTDYREWWMDWRAPDDAQLFHQPVIGTAAHFDHVGGAQAGRAGRMSYASSPSQTGWHLSTLGDASLASRKLSTFSHHEYADSAFNDTDWLTTARDRGRDLLDRFDLSSTLNLPGCASRFPHLLSPATRAGLL